MGVFDHFPYTNFHELNLMWILEALKEIQTTTDQFVAINSLKYADPIQWNIVQQYEKNTIVIDPLTGTAYISVQAVPSGVSISNEDYWTVVFDLGSFVVRAAKNFTSRYEDATTLTATFNIQAGEWLVWGDTLYIANVNITAGDSYVVGGNITQITVEEIKNEIYQTFNDIIGDLDDLTTTDKSNLVAAINEVLTTLITTSGDLDDLTTTDKSNLVAAINEVLTTLITTSGDLDDLDTTDKSNLVAAINELHLKIANMDVINVKDFGAVGDGITDDTTAIMAAFAAAYPKNATVYIPQGTYLISSTLVISYHINILCDGTIITNSAINMLEFDTPHWDATNLTDWEKMAIIDGLRLDMNSIATTGILSTHGQHFVLNDTMIYNVTGVAIHLVSNAELLINGVYLQGSSGNNTSIGILNDSADIYLDKIITVDLHTAIRSTRALNIGYIHSWISQLVDISDSVMIDQVSGELNIEYMYLDTYKYGIVKHSGVGYRIGKIHAYTNPIVATPADTYLFHTVDAGTFRYGSIDHIYIGSNITFSDSPQIVPINELRRGAGVTSDFTNWVHELASANISNSGVTGTVKFYFDRFTHFVDMRIQLSPNGNDFQLTYNFPMNIQRYLMHSWTGIVVCASSGKRYAVEVSGSSGSDTFSLHLLDPDLDPTTVTAVWGDVLIQVDAGLV